MIFKEDSNCFKKNVPIALVLSIAITVSIIGGIPNLVLFYSDNYWGFLNDLIMEVKEKNITNAVVFIKEISDQLKIFSMGFLQNEPDLNCNVIFARDLGDKNILLRYCYPDRKFYRYSYNEKKAVFELFGPL
jgi:hypothetical protein